MRQLNFNPFPILHTDRLTLRSVSMDDDLAVSQLRSDENVNKYLVRSKQADRNDAIEFILRINNGIAENRSVYGVIVPKNKSELIGTVCLWNFSFHQASAELEYELNPLHQGKGLMHEAIACVIDFGFNTMELKTIEAYTHKGNEGSVKLLKKMVSSQIRIKQMGKIYL